MKKETLHEIKTMKGLKHGFYEIGWETGGSSLASVGFDREGNNWMAPCNWTSGETIDWSGVKWYLLVLENDYKKKTKNIASYNQKVFI